MSVNKVIYYGEVLVDMTQVTVKPENLSKGETALDASGKLITGAHECEDLSAEVEEYDEHLDELETTIDTLPESGGEAPEIALQEKSVTPTKAMQTVEPDANYDGLSKVTVDAIPADYIIPSGTVNVTQNGTHDVRSAESVNVNVPAPAIKLQEKTATPTTSAQTVKPDSGYDGLSKVTVNAMPTATQATPSISVSSGGLITASATQSAGYVSASTKSATKQLTTQAAQTITPGTADKTIASGRYLTGTQTIKGDANLVAGNIKSGVSIFGVAGTYEGSGGGEGAGVDTCTFVINTYGIAMSITKRCHLATVYRDGKIECDYDAVGDDAAPDLTIENVVCGSVVAVRLTNVSSQRTDNCEYLGLSEGYRFVKITAPKGGIATFSVSEM